MILRRSLLIGAAALAMASGAPAAFAQEEPLKVGFIYVGPVGDFGWSYQHDQGRLALEKEFGDRVQTTYVESVPEGPDAERVLRQLATSGHKLIFATSFGFGDATAKIAKAFPDVKFEHATGYIRDVNLATYSGRFEEGRYILGVIAGKTTTSNKIGYIGAFPIPEVLRGVNAFTLGLQSVNPEATVSVVWANTWYDPGKEADAANAVIAQGADVIAQHTDSPAPLQAAENAGNVKVFGQASDMIQFAPTAQLTAIVDDWAPYYIGRVQAVLDGTWESQDHWGGLAAGDVHMAPYTNMPDEVKALAEETQAKIASGELNIFSGPISDRDGTERVAAGEALDDAAQLEMNWFVKGVQGDLPK
ncbi:BMP family ABC transporter substrate-binding protein [Neomegalonema sp.]|uniref:BMP family ABC transporter substrate-binding protein n=1 Tax=Neomegalonema sp. TaxID=2039713 RepID=UPI00261C7135|nr:BMP family ABC transporter substrate-binding protein [Neomegalonema sp.]MDD2868583.1 BMP family ABC transporter substrate-binding protein [Neomegalonema sp.]